MAESVGYFLLAKRGRGVYKIRPRFLTYAEYTQTITIQILCHRSIMYIVVADRFVYVC